MMGKKITLMLLVLLALSLPVGAAVISVDFQSMETGNDGIDPASGDVSPAIGQTGNGQGAFITGMNTEWNVLEVGDNDKFAVGETSGQLATMDGSATSYDVKFKITGSAPANKVGRLWAQTDYVFCTPSTYGGSNPVTEYEFSYTGLVAGKSYALKFFTYKNNSRITIDGISKIPPFDTGYTTFSDVTADANGKIVGYFDRNPGKLSSTSQLMAVQIRGSFDVMGGRPSGGELVSSAVNTLLEWTNLSNPDPNVTDVYVEVYCEQNPDPNVLVASGTGISSAPVDTTVLGDYYWRVDTYFDYVDENNKGPVTSGIVYHFVSVADLPVVSVDAGGDMIAWSGEPVDLSVTVVDDGKSALTYSWSADPNSGVALTEVPDDGDALASNSENPTVTITKATNNPSTVTLTVAVNDAGNPDVILEDSMNIDVYDDACKAASATGGLSAGDINGDCLTNLADLAVIAESWLIDTQISGPVLK